MKSMIYSSWSIKCKTFLLISSKTIGSKFFIFLTPYRWNISPKAVNLKVIQPAVTGRTSEKLFGDSGVPRQGPDDSGLFDGSYGYSQTLFWNAASFSFLPYHDYISLSFSLKVLFLSNSQLKVVSCILDFSFEAHLFAHLPTTNNLECNFLWHFATWLRRSEQNRNRKSNLQ